MKPAPRHAKSGSASRAWLAAAAAALACLVGAPAAQAEFSLSASAAPTDLTSGANSNFVVNMEFGGAGNRESVRDLVVHLPPGLVGIRTRRRCARSRT